MLNAADFKIYIKQGNLMAFCLYLAFGYYTEFEYQLYLNNIKIKELKNLKRNSQNNRGYITVNCTLTASSLI